MGTIRYKDIMKKNYGTMADIMLKVHSGKLKRVIAISSIFGKEAGLSESFTAAKAAVIAYMKSCSKKYTGATYNTICPGHIHVGKTMLTSTGIVGNPEDVAGIVTFLCSNKASHINGACITVDGGESHAF